MKQLIRKLKQSERTMNAQIPNFYEHFKDVKSALIKEGNVLHTGYGSLSIAQVVVASSLVSQQGVKHISNTSFAEICQNTKTLMMAGEMLALCSWRFTKRIYQLDPSIVSALATTKMSFDGPCDTLRRLPEWGMYISTNDKTSGLLGFMVFEAGGMSDNQGTDIDDHTVCMILDIEDNDDTFLVGLNVDAPSLQDAVDGALAGYSYTTRSEDPVHPRQSALQKPAISTQQLEAMKLAISATLYMCGDNPEYKGGIPGGKPKIGMKGKFEFPKDPRVIQVGSALGAKLREQNTQSTGAGKKPHLRKAHWHGVWTGPKNDPIKKQVFKLNWIPPLFVNCDPPTI